MASPSLLTTLLILLVGVLCARFAAGPLARWAVPAILLELGLGFLLGKREKGLCAFHGSLRGVPGTDRL